MFVTAIHSAGSNAGNIARSMVSEIGFTNRPRRRVKHSPHASPSRHVSHPLEP